MDGDQQEEDLKITLVSRDYFAPGALNLVYRGVVHFLHFKHATQSMGHSSARFDLLRRETESQKEKGGFASDTSVSILRMQNAPLSQAEKSLVPASFQGTAGSASATRQTEQLFGPMGDTFRQNVQAATDMEQKANTSSGDDDSEAPAAKRKVKEEMAKMKSDGGMRGNSEKARVDGGS